MVYVAAYMIVGALLGFYLCWQCAKPRCPSRGALIGVTLSGAVAWAPALGLFCICAPIGWFAENIIPKIADWMIKPVCKRAKE